MSEIKIVFFGHVDHGKSTIIGRLLHDTKSLPQGIIDKVQKISDESGKNFEYAYLLDAFAEERQQGITIDMTQIKFSTQKKNFLIIDAPGHKEFLKNMISGAANANAAFLVIDAQAGVQEQSRRHAYLLSLLGIKKIFVLVNKMDLVNFSEKRFLQVADDIKNFLATIKIFPEKIIPVSGICGDNILKKSENLSWYDGETFIKILDEIEIAENISAPLRFPIQDVYKFDNRRIIAGRIESGNLKIGDKIKIFPEGRETFVTEIAYWLEKDKKISVSAGESVGIIVSDEFFNKRGEIITLAEEKIFPQISNRLRASVFWMGKNSLSVGKIYKLKLSTAEVEAEVEKIIRTVDASTLENKNSAELKLNDVGEIIFKLKNEIAFDEFGKFQATGRFVLVENFDVAGGGIVLSAEKNIFDGTIFSDGEKNFHAEIFDEFYYDVEKREFTQVSETENKIYKIGDEIPTAGLSFDYPSDFDIILLSERGFIKIRRKKIISIGELKNYKFEKISLVNSRGFGIKINSEENFEEFLREYEAVENNRELANFSNKYFFLNQFRTLKFYFDYVI